MTATEERPSTTVTHPLEPLSAEEIRRAAALLRDAGRIGPGSRFISLGLREPAKEAVLAHDADGTAVPREAAAVVLDRTDGRTYEATVSLSDSAVTRWEHIPGVQPQVTAEEFIACKICTLSKRHDISGQLIRIWVGRFETRRLGRGRAGGLPNPEIWSQDHGFGVDGWTPGARDRAAKGALKHVLRVAGHPWPDGLVAEATRMTMPRPRAS